MRVELDVFSGRLNPRWNLLPHEARDFRDKLHMLPRREQPSSPKRGLGYRGLVATETGDEHGDYHKVVVSNGLVMVNARSGSELQYFEDRDRVLERWLLDTMRGRVDDKVYRDVLEEMNRT